MHIHTYIHVLAHTNKYKYFHKLKQASQSTNQSASFRKLIRKAETVATVATATTVIVPLQMHTTNTKLLYEHIKRHITSKSTEGRMQARKQRSESHIHLLKSIHL